MTDLKTKRVEMHRLFSRQLMEAAAEIDPKQLGRGELKRRITRYLLDHELRADGKIQFREYGLKSNPVYDPDMVYSTYYVESFDDDWVIWRIDAWVDAVPA